MVDELSEIGVAGRDCRIFVDRFRLVDVSAGVLLDHGLRNRLHHFLLLHQRIAKAGAGQFREHAAEAAKALRLVGDGIKAALGAAMALRPFGFGLDGVLVEEFGPPGPPPGSC